MLGMQDCGVFVCGCCMLCGQCVGCCVGCCVCVGGVVVGCVGNGFECGGIDDGEVVVVECIVLVVVDQVGGVNEFGVGQCKWYDRFLNEVVW